MEHVDLSSSSPKEARTVGVGFHWPHAKPMHLHCPNKKHVNAATSDLPHLTKHESHEMVLLVYTSIIVCIRYQV